MGFLEGLIARTVVSLLTKIATWIGEKIIDGISTVQDNIEGGKVIEQAVEQGDTGVLEDYLKSPAP